MMTSAAIRQQFLDFFRSKGHEIVPSAPIVVKDDPTLMFTNAGMNQFKDYFLGNKKPVHTRVADTQKCLRVSGKHNDLEEVGVDTYHHTMFEMLGNWSFGDYFKPEAIAWSWELLTSVYKLDKDKLYVTIFKGDEKEGLPKDQEAYDEWKKWIAEDRILLGDKKDNFWEMGDTGPCGPCTEIHVDCRTDEERKAVDGKTLVNNDHPQVIEIWNNVFIQFNRLKDGSLEPLPAKHVDTGMGFERLVRVIQNKQSNYDTDIFTDTIAETERITGKKYNNSDSKEAIAFRVIADHIRAISFTIADGQLPSSTGAGYVIRRILRRAVRYYYSYLDYKQPLLHQLLPLLAKQFENVFPELQKQVDFVSKVIKEEEEAFLKTLGSGISLFNSFIKDGEKKHQEISRNSQMIDIKVNNGKVYHGIRMGKRVFGEFAFELNDTYGFPIDLTQLLAKEVNWEVDMNGFLKCMYEQKERSRSSSKIDTEDWIILDDFARNEFVGYDSLESETKVVKYRKVKTKNKEAYQFVLEVTPFYAESGGQVGDTGTLNFDGEIVEVTDTKKENNLVIHFTDKLPLKIGGAVIAKIDAAKRKSIALHHSATHLLHAALRKVLGTHVAQKGSLVNDEHLRFDFSHFAKMTDEEIAKVETLINEKIRENIPVVIRQMPKEDALKLGAMALFGEKYGDMVRVVVIDPDYSVELCGGTHVGATGELGFFKIKHETAVAAGVRRIEAVTGKAAEDYIADKVLKLKEISNLVKNTQDIIKGVEKVLSEKDKLDKKVLKIESSFANTICNDIIKNHVEKIGKYNFITALVDCYSGDILKKVAFSIKSKYKDSLVIVCSQLGEDFGFFIFVNTDKDSFMFNNIDAEKIIDVVKNDIKEPHYGRNKHSIQGSAKFNLNTKDVFVKIESQGRRMIMNLVSAEEASESFFEN